MEGLELKDFLGYDTKMRKDDHQIISEYFVGTFKKGEKYDAEGTGLGWENDHDGARQGHRPAQHLQDEAPRRLLTDTNNRPLP